jgi:hypothetical protein
MSGDSTIGVDGARAIGDMLQRNGTLSSLSVTCKQPPFVGTSSSLCLQCAPTATRNAPDFADCFKTSETCLLLDGLEHNSSLTKLTLQGEMGMQANAVQLRGGFRSQASVVVQHQMFRLLCLRVQEISLALKGAAGPKASLSATPL